MANYLEIKATGRVVRVTNHNGLCLRRDDLFKILDGRKGEAVLDGGEDRFHHDAAHLGKSVVVCVERFRNDDFITGIHTGVEGESEAFATTGGDDDFIGGDFNTDAVVVFHQFFAVAEVAGRVGIGNDGNVGILDGFASTLRGLDVRLADV